MSCYVLLRQSLLAGILPAKQEASWLLSTLSSHLTVLSGGPVLSNRTRTDGSWVYSAEEPKGHFSLAPSPLGFQVLSPAPDTCPGGPAGSGPMSWPLSLGSVLHHWTITTLSYSMWLFSKHCIKIDSQLCSPVTAWDLAFPSVVLRSCGGGSAPVKSSADAILWRPLLVRHITALGFL